MKPKWIFTPQPSPEILSQIKSDTGCEDLHAKILYHRGLDHLDKVKKFFSFKKDHIHDPLLMKDMEKAVKRIVSAIENGEKILIYGDYDVDGTTAVALMYLYISKIYDHEFIDFYIPDRYTEGYGISMKGIDFAKEHNFSVIISLDCGIKSINEVAYAKTLGVDFIICDHHLPSEKIPDAVAVLNPKQTDCPYPYKELSGCGVGYKLCQALNNIYQQPDEFLYQLTDLLAISIASDIVPVTGENRTLLKLGLKYLQKTQRLGLLHLVSKEKLMNFSTSNIVFEIAPKINAAGRIYHGKTAVELLISNDEKNIQNIASQIINFNEERKELDKNITSEALEQIIDNQEDKNSATLVYAPQWSKGVIGIVASRLIEQYYRPTLVFTDGNEGEMVASGRSVADFDIHTALEQCSSLLLKFGGHRAAAGLTLKKEHYEQFKTLFEKVVAESIQEHQKTPSIEIDAVVNPDDLNLDFFFFYKKLEPFGPENMKPILVLKNIERPINPQTMGVDKTHLKFLIPINGINRECVGFGLGEYLEDLKTKKFDLAFSIEENHWQGNTSFYFNIKDINFNTN